jgi:ABC-type multidrug transport system ATPase subunit
MTITLDAVGKRFQQQWVLRQLTFSLRAPARVAISGPNGAGKTTLLRILSGQLTPSEGSVRFVRDGKPVEIENVYRHLSWAAPYMELIEELSLAEHIRFHARFKEMTVRAEEVIGLLGMQAHRHKRIGDLSSGMKQRVKLALALLSKSEVLLLDEPTSNLDVQGQDWYQALLREHAGTRLVIIASNEARDLEGCEETVALGAF